MKAATAIVLALAVVGVAMAAEFLSDERVASIRAEARGWRAGRSEFFAGKTEEQVRRLMGVKHTPGEKKPAARPLFDAATVAALPAAFNWRDKGVVGDVRNQGDCGSCWAFGGVEALSDRFRIAGRNVNASATDPVACDDGWFGNNGCDGGSPYTLWGYLASRGAVSTECAPYLTSEGGPIPTCPPSQQPCLNFVPTPSCNRTCKTPSMSWSGAKLHARTHYSVQSDSSQIMAEIHANGPVEGAFTVYSDFPGYKSGVYKRSPSAHAVGGHAIEIIGWGNEGGEDYWLVRNSWTTTWGDNGYFKILRGVNECGIEGDIVAGLPDV